MGLPPSGRALAGVLAMVGIPALAAVRLKEFAIAHPVAAVALVVAYETLLGIGTLLVRAMSKPMDRRLDQLGDAFDAALSRQAARYRRRYRAYVRASLRQLDSKGLATIGPFSPELGEVYVDVGLTPRAPGEVPTGALTEDPAHLPPRRALSDFVDRERPVVLALLGGPGSGKTTVLRRMAYQAAAVRRGRRRSTPVMLALRDHAPAIIEDPALTLPTLLRTAMPDREVAEPAGWWARKLRDGDCLILLDGLDEIARAEDRTAVSCWIEQQISVYPRNDYVVTSRPLGYETARITGADVLWVRPFNDGQVTLFLRNWYLATERRATGGTGPDVTLRAEQHAADLLERLAAAPALYDLTVNPLLLTMIANVHRYRGALPGSRAELYGEICQVMLYRRQEAKKLQPTVDIPGADKETLLAHLAYTMMSRRVRDLPREALLAALQPRLARLPGDVAGEDFLTDVANNGLLVEREHQVYAFAHHTFGEYLAARHIVTGNHARTLIRNVDDTWWRETTLLYLALPGVDADPIVRACLRAGSHPALALAFAAAAGRPLAPDLRQQLDDTHLLAFRPDADPAHRRLIAGVLATESLSQWIATPTGSHVCPQPVTTHLYTLFLRDTGNPPLEVPPAAPPARAEIVISAWAGDARAFTAWLNSLNPGPIVYRLPTEEEARFVSAKSGSAGPPRAVWTMREPDHPPAVWHSDDRSPVHTVTGAELHRAVAADAQATDVLTQLRWTRIRTLAIALTRGCLGDDTLALIRDLDRVLAHSGGLFVDHVRDLERTLGPVLPHVHVLDANLALDLAASLRLARTHGIAHDHERTLGYALGLDAGAGGDGLATWHVLAKAAIAPDGTPSGTDHFARSLLEQAGLPGTARFDVDLDVLSKTARDACAQLPTPVAQRFAEAMTPVLDRRSASVGIRWAALRLPALVLAAEANHLDLPEAATGFRQLAAGITLLQQRADDHSRLETILLARA
ncbi:hypothetical protein J2S43_002755 [Catenuloplanes nepalensis]|uniref:NACHT domain-containing protein n=1 Tax=Catenuloplanes nepalensis TaxID=587533 RepID=A0ABT9MS28_9ACTN|nr:NACHT domain-containing protein [Catenuloplanes nepalensis]MDP9794243.1 hypothetical protein [Catenuloplanes nepalensis]